MEIYFLLKKYSIIFLESGEIMKFNDTLNTYLESLNCSSKKLSKDSGLSEPTISRY